MELQQGDFVVFSTDNNNVMCDMVWEVSTVNGCVLVKTFCGFLTSLDKVLSVEKFE